jgi:RNA polymerase sigma-70 factor, ECF subfamily
MGCEPSKALQTLMDVDAVIVQLGGRVQFADFYEIEHDHVFRVVLAFCADYEIAQDATQEAFARAFSRWRRVSQHPSPQGWVITTAFNYVRRGRRRRVAVSAPPQVVQSPSGDRLDVTRSLLALPPRQRQAVVLFHIADQPIEAVAELMGISTGAVKSHLDRARKSLRSTLEESDV